MAVKFGCDYFYLTVQNKRVSTYSTINTEKGLLGCCLTRNCWAGRPSWLKTSALNIVEKESLLNPSKGSLEKGTLRMMEMQRCTIMVRHDVCDFVDWLYGAQFPIFDTFPRILIFWLAVIWLTSNYLLSSLTVMVVLVSTAASSVSKSSPLGSSFRLKPPFLKQENHFQIVLSHTTPLFYVFLVNFAAEFVL